MRLGEISTERASGAEALANSGSVSAPEGGISAGLKSCTFKAAYAIYGLCVAAAIAVWMPAIGKPLWMDETWFWWSIAAGFRQIPLRQGALSFPAGSYVLWLATKALGTSEIAMRIPSLLAMLGAAWLLYLAAREMFERDVALIAVAVFCVHPVVVFAATDVGGYAYAALMTNAAILLALRLRRDGSYRTAALMGLTAAVAIWFHYLFAVIAPALAVCIFTGQSGDAGKRWRQFGAAACGFAAGFAPVIPGVLSMFRTRGEHVYMPPPEWRDLLAMVTPGVGGLALFVAAVFVVGARAKREGMRADRAGRDGLASAALGLIPLGILYGVSALTPLHVSAPPWHMLSAAPGIALGWAWLARGLRAGWLRVAFCVLATAAGAQLALTAPMWESLPRPKAAVDFAEKIAGPDHLPVLVCSDFVESNHVPMPVGKAKESRLFAPLAYYRLSAPVVPLPKALNAEAMRVGGEFVDEAAAEHERFLAMGHEPSYSTLDWLSQRASRAYSVRVLGVFGDAKVMEFDPRSGAAMRTGGQPAAGGGR